MSTNEIHNTFSAEQTRDLGEKIAKKVLSEKQDRAFVLALKGDLGGGKTTFLQGFAKGLGIKEKILSPTFVIMKRFKIQMSKSKCQIKSPPALLHNAKRAGKCQNPKKEYDFKYFYHMDCYRIKSPKDVSEIGLKEIFSNPKNIVAIEWAERVQKILPKNTMWLSFEFKDKNKRKIRILKNKTKTEVRPLEN